MARLEGKIDNLALSLGAKLDAAAAEMRNLRDDIGRSRDEVKDARFITVATIIGSAIALAGLIVALALYGDAMFGRGMNVKDVVDSTVSAKTESKNEGEAK